MSRTAHRLYAWPMTGGICALYGRACIPGHGWELTAQHDGRLVVGQLRQLLHVPPAAWRQRRGGCWVSSCLSAAPPELIMLPVPGSSCHVVIHSAPATSSCFNLLVSAHLRGSPRTRTSCRCRMPLRCARSAAAAQQVGLVNSQRLRQMELQLGSTKQLAVARQAAAGQLLRNSSTRHVFHHAVVWRQHQPAMQS